MKWNFFAQDTVGKQLVKAADSIAANLSEGMEDTITMNQNIPVIIQEVPYMRQGHG